MSEHRWDDDAECWVIDTPLGPRLKVVPFI